MLFARETLQKNKKFTSYLRLDVILRTATTKNWNKFLPVVVEVPYLNRRTATNHALDDRRIRLPSLRYRCPIVLKKWPQEKCWENSISSCNFRAISTTPHFNTAVI